MERGRKREEKDGHSAECSPPCLCLFLSHHQCVLTTSDTRYSNVVAGAAHNGVANEDATSGLTPRQVTSIPSAIFAPEQQQRKNGARNWRVGMVRPGRVEEGMQGNKRMRRRGERERRPSEAIVLRPSHQILPPSRPSPWKYYSQGGPAGSPSPSGAAADAGAGKRRDVDAAADRWAGGGCNR